MVPYITKKEADAVCGFPRANFLRWIVYKCCVPARAKHRANIHPRDAESCVGIASSEFEQEILNLEFCGALVFAEKQANGSFDVEISDDFCREFYAKEDARAEYRAKHDKSFTAALSFEEAWKTYPRKVGKAAAKNAFVASVVKGADVNDIIKGTNNFAVLCAIRNNDPKFIPYGSTFFQQERWQDYVCCAEADAYLRDREQNEYCAF